MSNTIRTLHTTLDALLMAHDTTLLMSLLNVLTRNGLNALSNNDTWMALSQHTAALLAYERWLGDNREAVDSLDGLSLQRLNNHLFVRFRLLDQAVACLEDA